MSNAGSEASCRPGVVSSIPVWSYSFMDIDHEIISTVSLLLPLIQEVMLLVTSENIARSTGLLFSQACQGQKCD